MRHNIEGEGWIVSQHTLHYPRWCVVDENHEPVTNQAHDTKGQAQMELEALRNLGYVPAKNTGSKP